MIDSTSDVQLGKFVNLKENIRNWILKSMNVFSTQRPLHEGHTSLV